jgi:ketosteroid isomerase-like protein
MKTHIIGLTLALSLTAPGAALAADAQVEAPIRAFMAAFNKGDVKAAEATHTADVVIVDEPPPFVWKGPGAFQAWVGDLLADEKKIGRSDGAVTLGDVKREEVDGDHAYVIVEATYAFKDKGVPMKEPSQMTFGLRKVGGAWKISAWTWTGPRPIAR